MERAVAVLSEATNTARYIYDADFADLQELYEIGAEETFVVSGYFLLCDALQSEGLKRVGEQKPRHLRIMQNGWRLRKGEENDYAM